MTNHAFLVEWGVEELPSSFVDAALTALPDLVSAELNALRLPFGSVQVFGTPRRLAFLVSDLASRQPDVDEDAVGPPETAAFKDGVPTKAAEAFAAKLGVALSELEVREMPAVGKQKAGRYVVGRKREAGRDAKDLVGALVSSVGAKIPFRKSMRWGEGDGIAFGRPVQWLVALLDDQVLAASFAGLEAGRSSRGHRFLSPQSFDIAKASEYVDKLRGAKVLASRAEREAEMMRLVAEASGKAGGNFDTEQLLVDENASLVEWPFVVEGHFEQEFLELPASVIRSVARGHQRYFCVEKDSDTLVPTYLAVVNTAERPDIIRQGMDRVMRARLSDAKFFFDEDKKTPLDAFVKKSEGIVFHNRLGSVLAKVGRITKLAVVIARELGLSDADQELVKQAAGLCKADLTALMVGEFPELQGHMGRAYVLHAGMSPAVADAVRDHYKPLGASDAVAPTDIARCVALADRLDSLVGCFAVGLEPTGAADPYALRRAAIATLRTLLDASEQSEAYASLDLMKLVAAAYAGFDGVKLDRSAEELERAVSVFLKDRLRGLIASETSGTAADAVFHERADVRSLVAKPAITRRRARVVASAISDDAPWLIKARTVAKRLSGISKASIPVHHLASTFSSETDGKIAAVVQTLADNTAELHTEAQMKSALGVAGKLAEALDEVFTSTLVNDPNDALTPKRLELLSFGASRMDRIADFSRLGGIEA